MNQTIQGTIKKLNERIDRIIESDSGEELHLLPELITSLIDLITISQHLNSEDPYSLK